MVSKKLSELSDTERDDLRLQLRRTELKLVKRKRELAKQHREIADELYRIDQRLRDIEHSHHALEPHFK